MRRAMICLKGFSDDDGSLPLGYGGALNEIIEGGAQLRFWIKEYGGEAKSVLFDTVYTKNSSVQYENLEEWWYEDSISFTNQDSNHIFFRRGYKTDLDNSYRFYEDNTQTVSGVYDYPMHIFIRGQVPGASGEDRRGKIDTSIRIIQNESENTFPIFETKPIEEIDSDRFFEIGDTYLITGGYHMGDT
ncbi:hypothetical protein LCGC14_2377510, partial [marine sediment metagenome]